MIPVRLSKPRRIVSEFDPALKGFPRVKNKVVNGQDIPEIGIMPYRASLDLKYLGELDNLPFLPTIFEVVPLEVRHRNLDKGEDTNWWLVFQLHVINIENWDEVSAPLTWQRHEALDKRLLSDKMADYFPFEVVRDIAEKIIQLSSADGVTIPFSVSDTLKDILEERRFAYQIKIPVALSGDVVPKK